MTGRIRDYQQGSPASGIMAKERPNLVRRVPAYLSLLPDPSAGVVASIVPRQGKVGLHTPQSASSTLLAGPCLGGAVSSRLYKLRVRSHDRRVLLARIAFCEVEHSRDGFAISLALAVRSGCTNFSCHSLWILIASVRLRTRRCNFFVFPSVNPSVPSTRYRTLGLI